MDRQKSKKRNYASKDSWKINCTNINDSSNHLDHVKCIRRNSVSSDIKNVSSYKLSSNNTPVIRIMLKCVLELADRDLKPSLKAESLAVINKVLNSVPSVLQRQIMRNILLQMGLKDMISSLYNYNCMKLNEELKIFENGQHVEESIQLNKNGKHPLNLFSDVYMKLSSNKVHLNLFMELIENLSTSTKSFKSEILKLYWKLICTSENDNIEKGFHLNVEDVNLLEKYRRLRTMSDSIEKYKLRNNNKVLKKSTATIGIQTEGDILSTMLPNNMKNDENPSAEKLKVENKIKIQPPLPPPPPPLPMIGKNNVNNLKMLPLPPPPPPLPVNKLLQSSQVETNNNNVTYKSTTVYNKAKATNLISWTPVKILSENNIWNKFVEPEFTEMERTKLETVFEKSCKIPRRLTIATFGKRTKDSNNNGNNNQSLIKGLSEKRALNLGIVLSRFKVKGIDLVDKLDSDKTATFDVDLLSNLLLQYPTVDEMKYFIHVNESNLLNTTESFIWGVARKPHLKIKLEILVFESNFNVDSKTLIRSSESCLEVCKKLLNNSLIEMFFFKCLQIGNFLNQGSYAANAQGFTLSSLINTLTSKGTSINKSSTTRIIDLLVESKILNTNEVCNLCDDLEKIKSFDLTDLETAHNKLNQQLISIKTKVTNIDSFQVTEEMSIMFHNSFISCEKIKKLITDIRNLERDLQKYYCAEKMKLEEIKLTFLQAFTLYKNANIVSYSKHNFSITIYISDT
uniref:FH2 domain-containing protein n=1 Tax=Parastrongyloides trichosuri TaxID=131310 RepID=A0A0N4Z238_PARTI